MANKLQSYLDKKYWFMEQEFSNVSFLTILRRIVKDNWHDLWPVLFDHENWKYESNQKLTNFLRVEDHKLLPEYQLANKLLIADDINKSCAFGKRWIRQWWRVKWFDRKKSIRKLFQEKLQITDWNTWLAQEPEDQAFLLNFSIEELQMIYSWSVAFSQIYFLDEVFYKKYSQKTWFTQPGFLKRREAHLYLIYLLQNNH